MKFLRLAKRAVSSLALLAALPLAQAEPLKIGYSDWPGWVAWEIGIQKGWFAEEGVEVDFQWMDYVASMDAYAAGLLDAVTMTNGDALVTGGTGKPSVGIIINDFSNGNDMIVAAPGIDSLADLKGKKIGLEEGFVIHLLLMKGAEAAGIDPSEFTIVNTPTNETPQVLASGAVDAIGAWQPNSGQALKTVANSKPVLTSADVPGVIYDLLCVDPESLEKRRGDWMKVVKVWYRIVDFIKDEDNLDEALEILSARVAITPEEYEPFFAGTYILSLEEVLPIWKKAKGLKSVYGSTVISDEFNVSMGVYDEPLKTEQYLDPSLTKEYAKSVK
ncbi:ABC transporter substrate-binding protein [Pelagicoccus sp. NFK12]|uniref:ABC transporter substrate-binding protein n=1 Tax=Pelagicoccus enzymogenes TaxID=2773457 RepID=A0A927F908_9BACT|nr:ABC transporter substrate-binding protein [Pelagicoccus enzymogenes]MBD5780707.1 ABC transporter substrate-binding protein [Pelagicoccus enzymogenes]MDQ8200129.1 ABC transporter substrate-binding protein [Pelagicoccus enzymogenes]